MATACLKGGLTDCLNPFHQSLLFRHTNPFFISSAVSLKQLDLFFMANGPS
jgi:hypothetical protein